MSEQRLGELFAFLTAICWVIAANFFELSGKRIGSLVVNVLRLSLAVVLLGLFGGLTRGVFWPVDMPQRVFLWITLSGFIGFFLCDMCLFRAYVLAGGRRSILMLALAPVFAALLDVMIGQPPTYQMVIGMLITVIGVVWVITGRQAANETTHSLRDIRRGAILGLAAAAFQAAGALTANIALGNSDTHYDPIATTQVRAAAGALSFVLLILLTGRGKTVVDGLKDTKAVVMLSVGCVFGPVIGVALFMASLSRVQPSVTQTILATMPIIMLPIAYFIRKERIHWQAALGTVTAVAGVVVLCWR